jgi:hypothetical protein
MSKRHHHRVVRVEHEYTPGVADGRVYAWYRVTVYTTSIGSGQVNTLSVGAGKKTKHEWSWHDDAHMPRGDFFRAMTCVGAVIDARRKCIVSLPLLQRRRRGKVLYVDTNVNTPTVYKPRMW